MVTNEHSGILRTLVVNGSATSKLVSHAVAHTASVVLTNAVVHVVTNAIFVRVLRACPATIAKSVEFVPVAIAIPCRDVKASAGVDITWTVANAASVVRSHAIIRVVADAIQVSVCGTFTSTLIERIELIAIAVAVASRHVRTSALQDLAWTVANAASVVRPHAVVRVVADAIGIGVSSAITVTNGKRVKLVAVAVAIPCWDVRTSALVDLTWTVANSASVVRPHAIVHVVADAISIGVSSAVTVTNGKRIKLVAVAVAIPCWDVRTSALQDLAWTVAHTTGIVGSDTIVDCIAKAIPILICFTFTAAKTQSIQLVPVAIAVARRNVHTTAVKTLTGTIANATRIVRTHAIVHVVTNAIRIGVSRTFTAAQTKSVEFIPVAIAIASRDIRTSTIVNRA